MVDVVRLSDNFLCFSASRLTSVSLSLNSVRWSNTRIVPFSEVLPVGFNFIPPISFTTRKQLTSFKLCRTADEYPDIMFLKVNFDENKTLCKSLNVKVLPRFHFYRGADGLLESFSCSLAKFQKIKDAIELHNTARCIIDSPKGVGDLKLEGSTAPKEKMLQASHNTWVAVVESHDLDRSLNVAADAADCAIWNNDPRTLCYNCDSCKAGLLENLRQEWRNISIILIISLVVLIQKC